MRTYRAKSGPFADRPHYKLREIDRICGDALKAAGLMPDRPEAVRIDRFVEKHFKIVPRYEALPDGVLGYAAFGAGGMTAVVTTALDEEGGRWHTMPKEIRRMAKDDDITLHVSTPAGPLAPSRKRPRCPLSSRRSSRRRGWTPAKTSG